MNSSLKLVKAAIPSTWKRNLRALFFSPMRTMDLVTNYLYDMKRYLKYSSTLQFFDSETQLRSWIDADAHKLEKGLALEEPRPGFGKGVAERLVREINLYRAKHGKSLSLETAVSVLDSYMAFTRSCDIEYLELFIDIKQLAVEIALDNQRAGCDTVLKTEWLKSAQQDLSGFFRSRRSVRDFSTEQVDPSSILKAVEMAMHTPTVCNRQAIKAHAFTQSEAVRKVLRCQSGNSGFGDKVPAAIVVTVDRQSFFTSGERNQCWIDGGLFSMSLIYALHSLGLGTCCLNWSVTKDQDQALRNIIEVEESDAVIMMIAVGHLKDTFKVAKSTRKPIEEFITFENIKKP